MLKHHKIKIHSDTWKVYLLNDTMYRKYVGGASQAETHPAHKRIIYNTEGLHTSTIMHEVIHAYFSYCYLEAATIKQKDMEEIFCEFFSNEYKNIIKTHKEILKLF